jgi:predicted ferric reductase
MCFQAMYFFRLGWYEIFLAIHIVLGVLFIVGSWYHVNGIGEGHMEWLYASVTIWSFDRFIRLVRIFILNVSWSKSRVARKARLENVGVDAVKVTLSVGYNFNFKPGQYIFVYFPRFNFWESHPFTIASYDLIAGQPTITLLFRVHGGITKKLARHVSCGAQDMICLVEGPYGHHCPIDRYDNILLMAGGVGITVIFPYLKYLASLNVSSIRFIWVVRDEDSMKWFSKDIAEIVGSPNVEIEIHVTKSTTGAVGLAKERISMELGAKREDIGHPITTKEIDSESSSLSSPSTANLAINEKGRKIEDARMTALARCILVGSKPSLRDIVAGKCGQRGSLGVLACGPDVFVDEVRAAVAENVTSAKGVVDYYEEAYTW